MRKFSLNSIITGSIVEIGGDEYGVVLKDTNGLRFQIIPLSSRGLDMYYTMGTNAIRDNWYNRPGETKLLNGINIGNELSGEYAGLMIETLIINNQIPQIKDIRQCLVDTYIRNQIVEETGYLNEEESPCSMTKYSSIGLVNKDIEGIEFVSMSEIQLIDNTYKDMFEGTYPRFEKSYMSGNTIIDLFHDNITDSSTLVIYNLSTRTYDISNIFNVHDAFKQLDTVTIFSGVTVISEIKMNKSVLKNKLSLLGKSLQRIENKKVEENKNTKVYYNSFDELVKKVERITPDEIYNTKNNRLKDILGAGVKDEAIKENTKEKIDSVMNSYNKQKPKIKKVQLMFFGTIERKEGAVLFEEVINKHDIVIVDSGNGMVPAMVESIFDGEEKSTDVRVVGLIKLIL